MQQRKATEEKLTAKTQAVKKSTKEKLTVKVSGLKAKFITALKPMKKSVIVKVQTILILNKKIVWLKKLRRRHEVFHNKNIRAENSYDNGTDMEKFVKETDIKNSDGNDLIAKPNALKSFEKLII